MDTDPIQRSCQGQVRTYNSLALLCSAQWSRSGRWGNWRVNTRLETTQSRTSKWPWWLWSGSKHCRWHRMCHNNSNYSKSDYNLEDQCFCYSVTEGALGVADTWYVGKEHYVGCRERCSAAIKNTALLLATSVTFAMPNVLLLLLFSDCILDFYFRQDIIHTSPINPITAFAETYGKKRNRIMLVQVKREQSQDWFLSLPQSSPRTEF